MSTGKDDAGAGITAPAPLRREAACHLPFKHEPGTGPGQMEQS